MKQYKDKLYIITFSRPTPGRCLWGLPAQVKVFDNAMILLAGDLLNSSIAFIHSGLCQQFNYIFGLDITFKIYCSLKTPQMFFVLI